MLSFFVVFTLVLCSIHAYLYFKLRPLFHSALWQIGLLLFMGLMLALVLLRRRELYEYLPDFMPWVAYTWLGFILIACWCFLAVDAARILFYLVKFVFSLNLTGILSPKFSTPLALLAAIGLSGYALYEARSVDVKYISIASNKLPAGEQKVRIVAMSDLHIGETIGLRDLNQWAAVVRSLEPDLVVIVGDLIDADMSYRDDEARALKSTLGRLGGYVVLGNHEVYSGLKNARDFVRRSGFTLLENRSVVDDDGINVVGINDPQVARYSSDGRQPDVARILNASDRSRFTLLLKHQPIFQDGEIGLFDLQISGHTHGGQIWPAGYITRRIFGFRQGLTRLESEQGSSLLYLMNGTGYWGPPMRLGARPEIVVFDIVAGAN